MLVVHGDECARRGQSLFAMRRVIYSMGVSLDGFIAGPDGEIAVPAPDEELHRFHNQQARELGVHLLGRRLYEVLSYWDDYADNNPSAPEHELEFARIWDETPKIVFSRTLDRVGKNATLATGDVAEEVARLREEPGTDISVGGAGLASSFMELDLIDEYRPFVYPVVAGGGTAYFPALGKRIELQLAETLTFGSGVMYVRYLRVAGDR
jgi:dihydrofolate reductase